VPVESPDGMRVGRELGACTVGLIGMPPAARAMATMLSGFGCRVIGYEPSLHANDSVWDRWKVAPVPLRDLVEMSDAVAVQLNYFTRYQGLIGERLLPYAKRDQVLVSVSHSGVFDEASLAEALASGRIAAAWLDSLEPGALDEGRPLHGAGNLQITPRLASTTRESRLRSAWSVARRIDELLMASPAVPSEFRPTQPGEPLDLATEPESP
jgi:phosphoglycerate dehydrogenase-like enzyme